MLKLYDRLLDGLAFVSMLLIAAIIVAIGIDVGGRYLFNRPVGWVYEFVQHALVVIVFFGLPWLARERGHVTIDLMTEVLPPSARKVLRVVSSFATAAVCALVGFTACAVALDSMRRGVETTGIYPIQRAWLIAAIAIGFVLTAAEYFRIAVAVALGRDSGDTHAIEVTDPVGSA